MPGVAMIETNNDNNNFAGNGRYTQKFMDYQQGPPKEKEKSSPKSHLQYNGNRSI